MSEFPKGGAMQRCFSILGIAFALLMGTLASASVAAQPAIHASDVDAAFERARGAMMGSPVDAMPHVRAGERLAAQLKDDRERATALAKAKWLSAEVAWRTNKFADAEPLVADGLRLLSAYPEPMKLRGDLFVTRGMIHLQRDQAARALSDYQRAFRIYQQVDETRSQAIALQSIGALYYSANDLVRADRYFRQAAEVHEGDPVLSLSLHNRRGNILLTMNRYAEADAEYQLALSAAETLDQPLLQANILGNLARSQVDAGNLGAAETTLARGFSLARGSTASMLRRNLQATAARAAFQRGELNRARRLVVQSFDGLDLETTSVEFRNAHLIAHEVFSATNEYERALRHLEALQRITTEASKVATTTSAALMAARFDYANQELRIANLKAEELRRSVAYEQARARWQRVIFYGLGGATLVIIALLTAGLITIRRSRNDVRAANEVLAGTNAALEKALRAKTEFLATTSHEIRTPLNGILGMTQVMLADRSLPEGARERVSVVHGAGLTMRALVDDILDVSKMETGNLSVEAAPMDLPETLRDVTRMWDEQARAKGLSFRLELSDAPGWIVSDAARLRQIVFNLLSNAVKFTASGEVSLRAELVGDGAAQRIEIAIADSGIGIAEDKQEEIFESFRQVDAGTTRRFGGTGLGLTICRNLARAMGGDVRVESVERAGSTFTVSLPYVPAAAPAAPGRDEGGETILVVERNPIARSMLRTLIEPHCGPVRVASELAEAQGALRAGRFALVVADQATLAADGDAIGSLAQLVRVARDHGAKTAVLWSAPEEIAQQLQDAGVDTVLAKPVRGAALVAALPGGGCGKTDGEAPGSLATRAA